MTEYRHNSDSERRGRHTQGGASRDIHSAQAGGSGAARPQRGSAQQRSAAPLQGAGSQQGSRDMQDPRHAGQGTGQAPQRRQQGFVSQQGARSAQGAQQRGVSASGMPQQGSASQGQQQSRPQTPGARPTMPPQSRRQAGDPRNQPGYPGQAGGVVPVGAYGASGKGGGKGNQGKKQKKRGPWRVVFWIALVVFIAALVALGAILFSYWQGQNKYETVAREAFATPMDIESTPLADVKVDWEKLKAINPDTVGWIYIPGTVVNYPIVHTTNDSRYLTYDFNGEQSWGATYGSIFLSAANEGNFSSANNIVYGHNLNNGDMFACMAGFTDADAFNGHRTVYILTPQGNYRLTTFSLLHVPADDPLAQVSFASEEERKAYVQDKIDRTVVAPNPAAPAVADISQTFAFVTCDNLPSDGRYVLFAAVAETTVPTAASAPSTETVDPNVAATVSDASKEIAQ